MALSATDTQVDVFAVLGKALAGIAPKILKLNLAVLVQSADPGVQRCDFAGLLFHNLVPDRLHPSLQSSHGLAPVIENPGRAETAVDERPFGLR